MTPARWAAVAALAFALYFAIQGGEYGTTHLLELRHDVAREEADVARLRAEIDEADTSPVAIQALIVGLALLILFIGVYPELLLNMADRAALSLPEGIYP